MSFIYDYEMAKKSADYIKSKVSYDLDVAIILGSCLGSLADEIEEKIVIDYKDIPNFLISTVESHAGKLIIGKLHGKNVVCMSGRFHYYEGYDFEQLTVPIRVFKLLGIEKVILTNAAGAINKDYKPGDIMIINDHIKLMGASPLRGKNVEEFGPRFINMTDVYCKNLMSIARESGKAIDEELKEGVYFYFPGPQFETPAEIKAARILGGDAVGMSTVTEIITAAHAGMKVLGLSLITNMAAGVLDQPITVDEVDETASLSAEKFKKLIREILKRI